jgi:hypothetical protein
VAASTRLEIPPSTRRARALLALAAALWAEAAGGSMPSGQIVGVVTDASTGRPVAGARVAASSPDAQGRREAVTGPGGAYVVPLLPPGRYRLDVEAEGYRSADLDGLVLRVDVTLRANLVLVPAEVTVLEQVVPVRPAPAVDVGSAEGATAISSELLATVPLPRIAQDAAIVAPTALRDPFGVGFAGSTSPENDYVLDGLRVSDPNLGTLGSPVLATFVEQVDVKVGSFMPEQGYSSAGVVGTVLRSGSNEFHGSVWGNVTPGALSPPGPATWREGEAVASFSSPASGSYAADFGVEVGGPIVRDRLWFYAGLAPQLAYEARTGYYQARAADPASPGNALRDPLGHFVMEQVPGTEFGFGSGFTRYFGVAKLTWQPAAGHTLSGSFLTQPRLDHGRVAASGNASADTVSLASNATSAVVHYAGRLAEGHLLVEATAGWYGAPVRQRPRTVEGVPLLSTPRIEWRDLQSLSSFVPSLAGSCPSVPGMPGDAPGCYVSRWRTGGPGLVADAHTYRWAGSAAVTGLLDALGQHEVKAGVQIDYAQYLSSTWRTGGATWTAFGRAATVGTGAGNGANAFRMNAFGTLSGAAVGPGGTTRESWVAGPGNTGGKDPANPAYLHVDTDTWANGYFLQDRWTVANVLTLGFGVRLDTQSMTSPTYAALDATTPRIDLTGMWGPRVQAIWDFTGSGRGKVQGSWGRYYETLPLSVARAAFGSLGGVLGAYQLDSCASADPSGRPLHGPGSGGNPAAACPNVWGLGPGEGPGPNGADLRSVPPATAALGVSPGFRGNQGSYAPVAPGLQGQYTDQFGAGVQYEVVTDLSVGVEYLGRRLGTVLEDMSADESATFFVANPAVSLPWTAASGPYAGVTFNPRAAAGVDPATGTVYAVSWPRPARRYDAVSLSLTKVFSDRWLALASYTWSSLRGNYGGPFRAENAVLAPNATTELDSASQLPNRSGPLGQDRTHQLKVAGSYTLPLGSGVALTAGLGVVGVSGVPVNALGGSYLGSFDSLFLLPRGSAGRLSWTVDLDLSAQVAWRLSDPFTLRVGVEVFNVLDLAAVQWVDQVYTFDAVNPIPGASCAARDAVSSPDPGAALARDCPDVPYARSLDGRRATPNLNFGRPAQGPAPTYQAPIRVRFSLALTF